MPGLKTTYSYSVEFAFVMKLDLNLNVIWYTTQYASTTSNNGYTGLSCDYINNKYLYGAYYFN